MLTLLGLFAALRAGLLVRNWAFAADVPAGVLACSFLVGIRFDASVVGGVMLALTAWAALPVIGWQYRAWSVRWLPRLLGLFMLPVIFLCMAEWEFYREFQDRFNQLAVQYITDDPRTVTSMLWYGYPVVTYVLICLVLAAVAFLLFRHGMQAADMPRAFSWKNYGARVVPAVAVAVLVFFSLMRGTTWSKPPLRWGDAYFSQYRFANHLALNGVFAIVEVVDELYRHAYSKPWLHQLPAADALRTTRAMVVQPGDRLIEPGTYPLYRQPGATGRTLTFSVPPRNVVIILSESFNAQFIGALGCPYNATPMFDRLAQRGMLFENFFSQGSHTHQGLFVTMCSFPNLPGFEFLMKHSLGQQPFRSLQRVLREDGFSSSYIYNGCFTWDNQQGFFRNQGMEYFVGRDDFVRPKHFDPTWGVSDEDMFARSIQELNRLTATGRVLALLQTLSNHAPYQLPPPAPFADLKGPAYLYDRLNGIRYADWAMGAFFDAAALQPWYSNTLFVVLGDHAFHYESIPLEMDLRVYHVPLLLYYPRDASLAGKRWARVASQVDVLPTIVGLLGLTNAHQAWGRDVFRLAPDDPGWAVIKPSGSGQIVSYIRGDTYLSKTPDGQIGMYRYTLMPWSAARITDPAVIATNLHALRAYVQTGLDALMTRRAGVAQ